MADRWYLLLICFSRNQSINYQVLLLCFACYSFITKASQKKSKSSSLQKALRRHGRSDTSRVLVGSLKETEEGQT